MKTPRARNCANRHQYRVYVHCTCIIHPMSFVHYLIRLLLCMKAVLSISMELNALQMKRNEMKKGLRCLCVRSGCDALMIHFLFKFNPTNVCFSIKRIKWNSNLHNIHKSTIQLNISTNPNNNKKTHTAMHRVAIYIYLIRYYFFIHSFVC